MDRGPAAGRPRPDDMVPMGGHPAGVVADRVGGEGGAGEQPRRLTQPMTTDRGRQRTNRRRVRREIQVLSTSASLSGLIKEVVVGLLLIIFGLWAVVFGMLISRVDA